MLTKAVNFVSPGFPCGAFQARGQSGSDKHARQGLPIEMQKASAGVRYLDASGSTASAFFLPKKLCASQACTLATHIVAKYTTQVTQCFVPFPSLIQRNSLDAPEKKVHVSPSCAWI